MLKESLSKRNKKLFGSPIRSLSDGWFELLLVTVVLAVTLIAHGLFNATHIVVHFYYLPVIIAAHYFGRSVACTTALLFARNIFRISPRLPLSRPASTTTLSPFFSLNLGLVITIPPAPR